MKAIAVFEFPDCWNMNQFNEDFKNYKNPTFQGKPLYVKPLPEKIDHKYPFPGYSAYVEGWNDCIDELIGETE